MSIYVIMCLNFQPDQSPHITKSKGGHFCPPPPPGPGIESQTPVQIGLRPFRFMLQKNHGMVFIATGHPVIFAYSMKRLDKFSKNLILRVFTV